MEVRINFAENAIFGADLGAFGGRVTRLHAFAESGGAEATLCRPCDRRERALE